jgi:hypothetical protein
MLNFFKLKKKPQNLEINKKEIENGKFNNLIKSFIINRNPKIIKFQRWNVYKSKRHGHRISHRYNDRKKYNRN